MSTQEILIICTAFVIMLSPVAIRIWLDGWASPKQKQKLQHLPDYILLAWRIGILALVAYVFVSYLMQ